MANRGTSIAQAAEHSATYRYKIHLRFRRLPADPAEITLALGINPSRCCRAEELRRRPKGRPLGGRWPDSYWTATVAKGEWPTKRLVDAISGLLDQFAAIGAPDWHGSSPDAFLRGNLIHPLRAPCPVGFA